MSKLAELIVLFVAILTPQFLMCNELDGDELVKATAGIVLGGTVVAGYSVWKKSKSTE